MPIVYERRKFKYAQINESTNNTIPADYISETAISGFVNITDALSGKAIGDIPAWRYGKFPFHWISQWGVADIDLILGYDFWKCENYHFGLYAQIVAATGNKPNPEYLFSPVIGNGKHWEAGIGISGHMLLWECGIEQELNIYIEGNVTHMFKNRQLRSFDFIENGLLSRYLLLRELNADMSYKGLTNGINFCTRPADVTVKVKADFSIKLGYNYEGFEVDLGYNIYGNTHEEICIIKKPLPIDSQYFGIKSTQGIYATQASLAGGIITGYTGVIEPINATVSNATVCNQGLIDNPENIDNSITTAALAWNNTAVIGNNISQAIVAQNSNPVQLVNVNDLNPLSAASCSNLTQKIFGYINYIYDCNNINPFIGIGAEVEIDGRKHADKRADRWGIWIKGGAHF